jgi:hypothetical protein
MLVLASKYFTVHTDRIPSKRAKLFKQVTVNTIKHLVPAYADSGFFLTSCYLVCSYLTSYVAEQVQELELDSLVYSWDLELVLDVE